MSARFARDTGCRRRAAGWFIVGFRDAGTYRRFDFRALAIPRGKPLLCDILQSNVAEKYTVGRRTHECNLRRTAAWLDGRSRAKFKTRILTGDDVAGALNTTRNAQQLVDQGPDRLPRYFTERELARLMGYPDTFEIPVSWTQAMRQFGNSVVPGIVESIAAMALEAV